jgi:hypothetical protein
LPESPHATWSSPRRTVTKRGARLGAEGSGRTVRSEGKPRRARTCSSASCLPAACRRRAVSPGGPTAGRDDGTGARSHLAHHVEVVPVAVPGAHQLRRLPLCRQRLAHLCTSARRQRREPRGAARRARLGAARLTSDDVGHLSRPHAKHRLEAVLRAPHPARASAPPQQARWGGRGRQQMCSQPEGARPLACSSSGRQCITSCDSHCSAARSTCARPPVSAPRARCTGRPRTSKAGPSSVGPGSGMHSKDFEPSGAPPPSTG